MKKELIKFILTIFISENQYKEIARFVHFGFIWKKKSIKKENKKFDLFDYESTIVPLKENYLTFCDENQLYGLESILERYVVHNERICMSSEHGFFSKPIPYYGIYEELPAIITFGTYRKEALEKKSDCMVIEIGPYIHYAKKLWDDRKIKEIKKKNGKTLLVFPAHTIETTSYEKNGNNFLKFIKEFAKLHDFTTIIVSMYFVDILKKEHEQYEKEGYYIFSAGHRKNFDFLDRLKTVFCLADHVLSEGIGTHIGYSIYMKIPLTIYRISYQMKDIERAYIENTEKKKEIIAQDTTDIITKAFLDYHEYITQEQLKVCDYYFGNSKTKTPKELYECFCFARNVYNRSLCNGKPYYMNIKKELSHTKYSQQIYAIAGTNKYITIENGNRVVINTKIKKKF